MRRESARRAPESPFKVHRRFLAQDAGAAHDSATFVSDGLSGAWLCSYRSPVMSLIHWCETFESRLTEAPSFQGVAARAGVHVRMRTVSKRSRRKRRLLQALFPGVR